MSLRDEVSRLPRSPGVYLWKNSAGKVVYVGKAVDLRSRATSYFGNQTHKPQLLEHATAIEYIAVHTEKEALLLEQTLIKRHRPMLNVRLTDDKSYPYIMLTKEPYPRLVKAYGRKQEGTYFGPFPDGYGAFHVLGALNDLFPLRRCKTLPKTKCLYYDIGKCIAPCIDACTDDEYEALVGDVKSVLRGKASDVLRHLKSRIQSVADSHDFEEAARLRDQLQGLQGILEKQGMIHEHIQDRDIASLSARGQRGVVCLLHQREGKVIGQSLYQVEGIQDPQDALHEFLVGHYADRAVPRFVTVPVGQNELEHDLRLLADHAVTVEAPSRGDKLRWLGVASKNAELRLVEEDARRNRRGMGAVEALQNALGLPALPRVIEGFDISHQAGAHMRAAMVRFLDGEPQKSGYRTFKMATVGSDAVQAGTATTKGKGRDIDDFAAMGEAVGRRLTRLRTEGGQIPDLILIDGGPGQLKAAQAAARDAGVQVAICSLAKRDEEVFLPNRVHPVRLARDHPGLQLLQRVRDESHRFGITQVRRKATAAASAGPLETIPGVGPTRRRALLQAFAGMDGLRAASAQDIAKVPGIHAELATRIRDHLQIPPLS